jgi:hypothetical protein
MIVGPADADIQMTFAQISLKDAPVDWNSVCGNVTSAVAPLAINEGMVRDIEPATSVRIFSTNGVGVDLEWLDPAGSTNGKAPAHARPIMEGLAFL